MEEKNPRSVLDKRHWLFEDYTQRMTTKEWKAILLACEDHVIYKGVLRKLKSKNIGCGVIEVFKTSRYYDKPKEDNQPHVWKVGDYALCPDGKVRKVKSLDMITDMPALMFPDSFMGTLQAKCTPVPEPEMPELRYWETGEFGTVRYQGKGIAFPLGIMITACQDYGKIHYEAMKELLALDEWRELTGRTV